METLSNETGLSIQNIRTAIKHLKSTDELTERKFGKHRIVKLKNYIQYQSSNTKVTNKLTMNQQGSNREVTAEYNVNTVKTVNNKKIEKKVFINYGEYVRLTETQYSALSETYSEPVLKSKIEDINNYCASHNKSYKDYSAVVRSWMKREGFIQPFDWSKYTDEELMPILKERPELCKEAQIKRPTALFLSQTMT